MGGFTGLAIFISCLGLWVLVMFSCAVRTKGDGYPESIGGISLESVLSVG